MPSASTKVEITASSEALEPIKKVLTVVDKKVRNLEKRKLKLDAYREKQDGGEELEPDQQVAVARYGEVVQNLEFARELQKQFNTINTDAEKQVKKQAKRGKVEKQSQEVKKVKEVLQVQGLLDSLGADSARTDFQTGKHGAIVLTEENLEQLDELYKLISPTREAGTDYCKSLTDAADHLVNLLDAKEKAFAGSTYKELKELLDLISGCGYFERTPAKEEEQEKKETEEEFEVVEHQDVPEPDSEEVHRSLPPEVTPEPVTAELTQTFEQTSLDSQSQVPTVAEADSFFSGPVPSQTVVQQQQQQQQQAAEAYAKRPFQDIVSSVQGSFNFLQESTIEVESKQREFSPHMDPAVVAAHPMPKSMGIPPSTQNPDTSAFGNQPFTQTTLASDIIVSSHEVSQHSATVDQNYSQAKTVQSQPDFVANSGFAPSNLSHTMQTDNLFVGSVTGPSVVEKTTTGLSHNVIGTGASDPALTQFEIPPSLPMPPGHDQTTQDSHLSQNEKKGFPMNPNASEFHSLYTPTGQEEESNNKQTESTFQEGTYTNSNYQNRDQRSGGGRGNYRGGRGNRGSGMSNGYQRGGGRNNAGSYERSNSGGGNYQGYPPRDNYRPDGYQGGYGGSGNNFNSGGGFQKRNDGGRGAPRGGSGGFRGGPRGGSQGYNRGGGSGYNRGGAGGSAPNNGSRTGNNQGFGRPNFNQQQVAQ